jgi:hypothetical protein
MTALAIFLCAAVIGARAVPRRLALADSETFSAWLFDRRDALNDRYVHALERAS